MDTIECIKTRRSIRKFKKDKVSHSVLEKIVESASYSPSWKNTQISRYVIIEDENLKNEIADSISFGNNQNIIKNAPILVVVNYIKNRSGYERDGSYSTKKGAGWEMFDAGIATQTFCLAAHEHGVSSVIMGIFEPDEIAKIIELSDDREVGAILAIGYADEEPKAPRRKTVDELISYK